VSHASDAPRTTERRTSAPRIAPRPEGWPWVWPSQPPPQTTEQRLERIEALARRVQYYVQFIAKVGDLRGASGEAKEKAVAAFHERMAALERQLGLIHESLQLG
jgi:hypothetical protein